MDTLFAAPRTGIVNSAPAATTVPAPGPDGTYKAPPGYNYQTAYGQPGYDYHYNGYLAPGEAGFPGMIPGFGQGAVPAAPAPPAPTNTPPPGTPVVVDGPGFMPPPAPITTTADSSSWPANPAPPAQGKVSPPTAPFKAVLPPRDTPAGPQFTAGVRTAGQPYQGARVVTPTAAASLAPVPATPPPVQKVPNAAGQASSSSTGIVNSSLGSP